MAATSGAPATALSSSESRSVSTWKTETITGYHDFNVDGYSLVKGIGIGQYISSDVFAVGGYSWNMRIYPDGYQDKDKEYISVFLAFSSRPKYARASYEINLFGMSGKLRIHSAECVGPRTFEEKNSMWGWCQFIKRSDLETSNYFIDDCLRFSCRVTVLLPHTGYTNSIPLPTSNINQHFGRLLESGEGADIKFQVDEEIFSAHKTVLAARSPVFKTQFFGSMKDANAHCIKIEDMEPPVFKALLHFMYWDDLPNLKELTGIESKEASTLMYQHLFAAADRYNLDQLVLICAFELCNNITIETVATILTLAGRHNFSPLKSACFKFLALNENLQGAIQREDWKYLKETSPHLYLELLEYLSGISQNIDA